MDLKSKRVSMNPKEFNHLEISNIIKDFNNNKCSDICVRAVKFVNHTISPLLADLFNQCTHEGIFPEELKIARVIPLYKADDPHLMNNYRPISILPLFSKIFEKLLHSQLSSFIDKYNILYSNQFDFRKQHSTSHALNISVSKVSQSIFKKMAILLDCLLTSPKHLIL